ncbi:hypothetical protein JOL62DRAFT_440115 [Phyllosticta paracitricarpa]|uniref:Secreted protein n=1 Tax=Phyllosticta paracitricarpa TaxID=2016321 RepID=A0ABR1NEN2_9PEZI
MRWTLLCLALLYPALLCPALPCPALPCTRRALHPSIHPSTPSHPRPSTHPPARPLCKLIRPAQTLGACFCLLPEWAHSTVHLQRTPALARPDWTPPDSTKATIFIQESPLPSPISYHLSLKLHPHLSMSQFSSFIALRPTTLPA